MDPKMLLDGPVEDVKARLADVSNDDLLKLREAESGDRNREDVLLMLDGAIMGSDAARAGGRIVTAATTDTAAHALTAADLDGSGEADIAPAKTFSTSGAPAQVAPAIDTNHPAVDSNPRARTTAASNRIDFNEPVRSGSEIVTERLAGRVQPD